MAEFQARNPALILYAQKVLVDSNNCEALLVEIKFVVEVVEAEHGRLGEGVQCAALLLRRSTRAACAVYESADATHLEQFILLRVGHVLVNLRQELGAHALLYRLQNLERVGYWRLLHAHHIAHLHRAARLYGHSAQHDASVLAGVGSYGACLEYARCPQPFVYTCYFHVKSKKVKK